MDTLAIPSTSQRNGRPQPLRAVRSTGSLRTPHGSQNLSPSNGHGQSLSRPDLSFSRSDLHSDQENEFMGSRNIIGSTSTGKNDSWKSAYSNAGGAYLSGKQQGKQRVRLDSVFGTQLPGFPYLNSAAAATSGPILSSHPLHGSSGHDLRNRSSRTWSDRSHSAAGSYSGAGSGSRSKTRTASGSTRARSSTIGMDSETSATSTGGNPLTDLGEADISCSGGSNSSDEVDLDLSFDMEVLRARQQQLQEQARQKALASQARKGKQPAPHVGIDMSSQHDLDGEENTLPNQPSALDYRRYRLGGKQRMSRSAVELRSEAQRDYPGSTPQPYYLREEAEYHRHSGRSDPGKLTAPGATTWARQPSVDLSVEIPDDSGVAMGWSFATTPPLSPAELVTFTEQNHGSKRTSRSHSDNGTNISGNGEGRRGSFGASALLRKRRPSFPLMYLLDKAIRGNTHDHAVEDDDDPSPPLRGASAVGNNEDLTISSFGFTSPTPTQANMHPEHYRPPSAPLPPLPPTMPAAVAERNATSDSYTQSPTSINSPNFMSSPETMTADLTPGTSAWNSPRAVTIEGDEVPTPKTGEFDHRFSQYSMSPAMGSESGVTAGIKNSLQRVGETVQEKEAGRRDSQDKAAVAHKPSHTRQSSSIFRLPFVSSFFSPFRPASPATTVLADVPEVRTPTTETGTSQEASSRASTAIPRIQELGNSEISARAASPTSADSHGPAESSEGSHAHSSISTPPSPPRDGARPSRLSGVIDDSMLRPGPNIGKGRLAGLGLSFEGQQRQSSLPVLAFSAASSDENHSQDSQHQSSQSHSQNGQGVRSMMVLPAIHPCRSTESTGHQITVVEQSIRRPSMSAPATTVHFPDANLDLRLAASGPRTASPRLQNLPSTPVTPSQPGRPRTLLPKTSDFDLRARIDGMKPAQLLFLSAFVLGPWCFVLGGWGLRNLDGECTSVKGVRCRCPEQEENCVCQAEVYRQIRLSGGKYLEQIQDVVKMKGGQVGTQQQKELQIARKSLDKYVLANRIAALLCGTVTLVLGITALIVLARTW